MSILELSNTIRIVVIIIITIAMFYGQYYIERVYHHHTFFYDQYCTKVRIFVQFDVTYISAILEMT